jgi:hypothetical protein
MFKKLVSADGLKLEFGTFFNIVGVAVEIFNYPDFRKTYFEVIDELKQKYRIDNLPRVIKKKTISRFVPSYNQKGFIKDIVETLIDCEYISFIQVTETFIRDENVRIPYQRDKIFSRSEFARNILSHYYPLVPVWKYFQNKDDAIGNVVIDHIDGKITNIWSEVGRIAENLVIVPHGDETYPCISICDIMCEYIRRMVKEIKAKEIEDYFRRDPGIDIVKADYVGDTDVLVPRYPHSINPQNFYPHPILFIECSKIGYDNEDKNLRKRIIEDSLLYKRCLDFAEKHNGCVTFFDVKLH